MGKKSQDPVYMSQKDYDKTREQGFEKEGPRKDSVASNRQSKIGNVPKGDKFSEDQRNGMLAEVEPEEEPEKEGMGWLAAAGLAVGFGAALFGGYKAYQYFKKDDDGKKK